MLLARVLVCDPSFEFDSVGAAFFSALARNRGGPVVLGSGIALAVLLFVAAVWWVRREVARERAQRAAFDARHRAALEAADRWRDPREWVRVAAKVPTSVRYAEGTSVVEESSVTRNLSAGGGAFTSVRPPALGHEIEVALALGDDHPLRLQAVVVRVEPPEELGDPSLVGVKFVSVPPRDRETVVRWVTLAQLGARCAAQRGRAALVGRRPVAEGRGETYSGRFAVPLRKEERRR